MDDFSIKIEFGNRTFDGKSSAWLDHYFFILDNLIVLDRAELNEAGAEVKKSIEQDLYRGITFEGDPVKPLKPSTIARKGHSKVFFDTGELYRSVRMGEIPNGVEIFIADGRALVASILQRDRPFFGITPVRAEVILRDIFEKAIRKFRSAA